MPKGALEVAISDIYAELLGLDPAAVSSTANFFDLGGTSRDVINLRRRIERRLSCAGLPLGKILQNPTVRVLAARIALASGDRSDAYDPIVPLQLSGRKTPLFCVHPDVGEILEFVDLAKYFAAERPFFAIRARGLNEGEAHFATFDEMVFAYVDAIRRRQPHGPYAVAGYSYGGPVAFEIGKVLESKGERVAFVGSIDMPPRLISLFDAATCVEQLAALGPDLSTLRSWTAVTQSLLTLGRSYVPSGRVNSVAVFCAHSATGANQDPMKIQVRRWDDFTRMPNRYINVAGEHHTLMGTEHVASFQAALRTELDHALRGD